MHVFKYSSNLNDWNNYKIYLPILRAIQKYKVRKPIQFYKCYLNMI